MVGYFRNDIDRSSPDFTIKSDAKYREIYATIEGTDIKFTAIMSRERFLSQLEIVLIGEHVLDVMSKDPCSRYSITDNNIALAKYSHHYFNNCAYYIEYKNGYVTKIVKITADSITEIK